MRFVKICFSFLLINALPIAIYATSQQEKIYLTQILNQLNAIQPLIVAAAKTQEKNTRIQFHYTQYPDAEKQIHNGLLEDIQAIKKGIEEQLNQIAIEPRHIQPIQGDYLNNPQRMNG